MTSSLNPAWLNDYSDFVSELRKNFGLHNPEGDLENLRMRDNQRIVKYLIDFNQLAAHVQWGKATLSQQLYCGLPSRIKDEIAHIGKPDTHSELYTLAQSINSCYWEHHSEVARETPTALKPEHSNDKGKGTNTNNSTTPNSDKNKNNNSNNKNNSSNSSTSNTTGNANSSNSNQKKPNSNLSLKLRKTDPAGMQTLF